MHGISSRCRMWLISAAIFLVCSSTLVADDPPEANRLAQTAMQAQNAGDFKFAATTWESLISQYPESSQIGIACYQAGYCHIQTEAWDNAIKRLEQAIAKLDSSQQVSLAQSYLFLGFAESKLGRELLDEEPKSANQLLTTATQTFVTLLKKFPDFEDADQALFFQGESFEALGRLDEAADSYDRMLKLPDPEFKLDGLFALAFIRAKQGKYNRANELYEQFEAEGTQHPSFNEVRFLSAELLTRLARAARTQGDEPRAAELLKKAMQKFAAIYQTRDADWADKARFEQAQTAQHLGQHDQAAELFESITQIPQSKLVDQARVYAGREFLRAGKGNEALQTLEKAIAIPSPWAPEAAHWLAKFHLQANENDQAYLLASEWIDKAEDDELKVQLMLDQADAAYASSSRRDESESLYLKIVNQFPQHRLAPTALYNASWSAMDSKRYDQAVELTRRFRKLYENSDYLPDAIEVEADSLLLGGEPAESEKAFRQLIEKFGNHPKANGWRLRTGYAIYTQKNYQQTIDWLQPLAESLQEPAQKAEALHWIGSSQLQLGETADAVATLQNSLDSSDSWRRTDETMLALSRALFADGSIEKARSKTAELIERFPDSALAAEANYRLGEFDYDAGEYEESLNRYVAVATQFPESQFAAHAQYGRGWSLLQLKKFAEADAAFTELIEQHADHDMATQALVGRAAALRQSGKPEPAIADIDKFLKSDPAEPRKLEALYEKGLSQISLEMWPEVVATFSELIAEDPDSALGDRYHYELAWALRSTEDDASAIKHFAKVAETWPNSPLAAESGFHVAQAAYQSGEYEAAANGFSAVAERSPAGSEIREKAIYKLAWSHYKQKDFDNALAGFRRQIKEFPAGSPLHADGLFMVSETLFEKEQFEDALKQYTVARPIMKESDSVSKNYKILTFLHGAQSANRSRQYDAAIEFADALLELEEIESHIQQEAQMELGDAYRGKQQFEDAMIAFEKASKHPGRIGARSMCMIGEILLDQKKFDDAINRFKLVLYGYGGTGSADEVKPWQAFAAFEAARCDYVRISSAATDARLRQQHIAGAKKHFGYLVENYPDDKLAPKAKEKLQQLEALED